MKQQNYLADARKISCLENAVMEERNQFEIVKIAIYILEMYFEDGNDYSADLNCDSYKDKNRNKLVREKAKKEVTQLRNYIKKYS